jgi:hypothetical protein
LTVVGAIATRTFCCAWFLEGVSENSYQFWITKYTVK